MYDTGWLHERLLLDTKSITSISPQLLSVSRSSLPPAQMPGDSPIYHPPLLMPRLAPTQSSLLGNLRLRMLSPSSSPSSHVAVSLHSVSPAHGSVEAMGSIVPSVFPS